MIIVERVEGGTAVLESDGKRLAVPLSELPSGVHEGSVLYKTANGYKTDENSEKKRRGQISAKRRRIFRK